MGTFFRAIDLAASVALDHLLSLVSAHKPLELLRLVLESLRLSLRVLEVSVRQNLI